MSYAPDLSFLDVYLRLNCATADWYSCCVSGLEYFGSESSPRLAIASRSLATVSTFGTGIGHAFPVSGSLNVRIASWPRSTAATIVAFAGLREAVGSRKLSAFWYAAWRSAGVAADVAAWYQASPANCM